MAFEAAFGITAVVSVVLFVVCRKLWKENGRLREENATAKANTEALPAIIENVAEKMNKTHGESFKADAVEPMKAMVKNLEGRIEELGMQSAGNREKFDARMDELARNTGTLAEIFRSSQKRGRHAEMSLERLFEIANLKKGFNYDRQPSVGDKQPDFVVHLPGKRSIVVDSKAPLDALWRAFDTDNEDEKAYAMGQHLEAVKKHIVGLSKKKYWESDEISLDFVVMVMHEYALLPALDKDGKLIEFAYEHKVILVTPSTLLVLLRTIELTWKQDKMAEEVKNASKIAADLHSKLY